MEMILLKNGVAFVKIIGHTKSGEKIGITNGGRLFVFCFSDNSGREYDGEIDGVIKFD